MCMSRQNKKIVSGVPQVYGIINPGVPATKELYCVSQFLFFVYKLLYFSTSHHVITYEGIDPLKLINSKV
jgi:hypothetical protein